MQGNSVSFAAAMVAALALATALPATAQDRDGGRQRAPVVQQLLDCRAVTDPAERLACFDRQVAAFAAAEQGRDIMIADRAQVRETRRGLFGLSLGDLNIFGGGGDDDEQEAERDIVQQIEGTLREVGRDTSGRLVIVLDNGQRWIQTDTVGGRQPRAGQAVVIRRASLGSFMASVEGRPGFRVRRDR